MTAAASFLSPGQVRFGHLLGRSIAWAWPHAQQRGADLGRPHRSRQPDMQLGNRIAWHGDTRLSPNSWLLPRPWASTPMHARAMLR